MANKTEENALLAPLTSDKFQGFSVRDGELLPTPAPKAAAKAAPKAARPSGELEDDAGQQEQDQQGQDQDHDQQDQSEGAESRPSKSVQRRINNAVGRQRAAERARDAAERTNQQLERRLAVMEGQLQLLTGQRKAPSGDSAPDPKNYPNGDIDARYIADLARHEGRQAAKADREESDKAARERTKAENATALQKQIAKFDAKGSEKYEDFHDVVFSDDFPLTPTLGELALSSEHGIDILYELANDTKEADRVLSMTPARQAAWFGTKEAALSSESPGADEGEGAEGDGDTTPPKATNAPQPSTYRVRGNGGVPRINAATTDFAAFERLAKGGRQQVG